MASHWGHNARALAKATNPKTGQACELYRRRLYMDCPLASFSLLGLHNRVLVILVILELTMRDTHRCFYECEHSRLRKPDPEAMHRYVRLTCGFTKNSSAPG